MEVVVRLRILVQELGEELKAFHVLDRVAELLDGAGEVEYQDEFGINLIDLSVRDDSSFGIERLDKRLELRRQPLTLSRCRGCGETRGVPVRLPRALAHIRRS
ncbi:hypothetical protein GCM10009811_18390 [Nostocoides veronense]|uniref:Uncharacterized protein n=1 Tax=Nostocoides veronense TaxID=330836 RepID=A0ABP4XWA3_9MICO